MHNVQKLCLYRIALLMLATMLFFVSGCATTSQTIRILEKTELQIPHVPGVGKVEGTHCTHRVLFVAWQSPRLDLAIKDALAAREHKYNALADVELIQVSKPFLSKSGFFGSKDCIHVIGRPILLAMPTLPENYFKPGATPEKYSNIDWDF